MNIEITDNDKININSSDTLFRIMRRILLREDTIDREKEHFWMIGLNMANIIVYIELVSLGSVRATIVEPMNVYRVAVLKGATSVIAVHNHPSGNMTASEADKDETDRLIQVGKILNIKLLDHLIISTDNFISFANIGLMEKLEQSIKYVPTYQIQERIRDRELELKKEKSKINKLKKETDKFKEEANTEKSLRIDTEKRVVTNLLKQNMTIEEIATILNVTAKEVEQINKK
ncbi:JAB domain-containing protein [Flavobacterium branchiarum]|uniref:JAB domain-containing protein n=1 Tax=Flavobacterium branchiarum TaxID=1114870 RepID=A0ABV5FS42_9FLAO|nr:JAB domain-containing protein [Flavobacterium branchiarum]MDN3673019.1 JAB domain-containing protein [Flavobacterium branchiarum]